MRATAIYSRCSSAAPSPSEKEVFGEKEAAAIHFDRRPEPVRLPGDMGAVLAEVQEMPDFVTKQIEIRSASG
jgi:hypothetical protein